MSRTHRITYENLLAFHRGVLSHVGADEESREAVAQCLCETSLRGVDSHGARLLPHYARSALTGRKNPRPDMKFSQKYPAVGRLDADNGYGQTAGLRAVGHCLEMADENGVGVVGVINAGHPGAMASYALKAARRGYIGFAFTHADSLLLSYGGVRPYFGTNPICMAAPREEEDPYCFDSSPSLTTWNKVMMHKANKITLDENLVADKDGNMTTDPEKAASLISIGKYKGYALASMVEILCSVFTGMAFGRHIPAMYRAPMDQPRRLGQFYMAIKTDGCVEAGQFVRNLQIMSNEARTEPAKPGERILMPGDKENNEARRRAKDGIPLDDATVKEFLRISQEYGVELNWMM